LVEALAKARSRVEATTKALSQKSSELIQWSNEFVPSALTKLDNFKLRTLDISIREFKEWLSTGTDSIFDGDDGYKLYLDGVESFEKYGLELPTAEESTEFMVSELNRLMNELKIPFEKMLGNMALLVDGVVDGDVSDGTLLATKDNFQQINSILDGLPDVTVSQMKGDLAEQGTTFYQLFQEELSRYLPVPKHGSTLKQLKAHSNKMVDPYGLDDSFAKATLDFPNLKTIYNNAARDWIPKVVEGHLASFLHILKVFEDGVTTMVNLSDKGQALVDKLGADAVRGAVVDAMAEFKGVSSLHDLIVPGMVKKMVSNYALLAGVAKNFEVLEKEAKKSKPVSELKPNPNLEDITKEPIAGKGGNRKGFTPATAAGQSFADFMQGTGLLPPELRATPAPVSTSTSSVSSDDSAVLVPSAKDVQMPPPPRKARTQRTAAPVAPPVAAPVASSFDDDDDDDVFLTGASSSAAPEGLQLPSASQSSTKAKRSVRRPAP